MRFEDVVMDYDDTLNGVQGVVEYGDYELSIIKHSLSYGGRQGLYEIGVWKGDNQVELPGITSEGDTVKGYLTEAEVSAIMTKMFTITRESGKQL
jgi:hypothetical protein